MGRKHHLAGIEGPHPFHLFFKDFRRLPLICRHELPAFHQLMAGIAVAAAVRTAAAAVDGGDGPLGGAAHRP